MLFKILVPWTFFCTDKTGTLTAGKVALVKYFSADNEIDEQIMDFAYLNSAYQTGMKNVIDAAVLDKSTVLGKHIPRRYRKIGEIPFDFKRRRMSVAIASGRESGLLICKGSVTETLAICTKIKEHGQVTEISKARLRNASPWRILIVPMASA